MAKGRKPNSDAPELLGDRIEFCSITDETRRRYLNYAMSVIMSRALPDVRDGLKPVQRRILHVMYSDLGLDANSKPRKCAKIAGDTIGNYHPHGNQAAYDTLVRMAQSFSLRYPLVDGQGNFGSIMGLPAAADRYTEARTTAIAEQLMNELRYRTVEFRPNYDGTRDEPVVLPSRFPNLLVNGATGIAVGMATNIPPHNLKEVVEACVYLVDHWEEAVDTKDVLKFIKGPDFPLGGRMVTDRKALRQIYEEGRGAIKVRGEWKHDKEGRSEVLDRIIVTSVPYGVETGPLATQIGDVIASRKLPQLEAIFDETDDEHGLRLVLELKKGVDAEAVMAYLFKHTSLEQNFAYNSTCLAPNEQGVLAPMRMPLVEMLRHFLTFRKICVTRRFEFQLAALERRIHILSGLAIIFHDIDKALKLIRQSTGKRDAADRLMKAFPIDEEQTMAILELQLYRISQLEITSIQEELEEKQAEAEKIRKTLASQKKLWGVIRGELEEVGTLFGDKRRTAIGSSEEITEYAASAYIVRENTNVVLTREGWVKRVGRLQSVDSTRVREGDRVLSVVPGSTHDTVVFFASDGMAYTLPIEQIPVSSGYGEPLSKHVRMKDGVTIVAALGTDPRFTPEDTGGDDTNPARPWLLVFTARGQTLRVPLGPFRTPSTKVGRKYARLSADDRIVWVELLGDAVSVFVATRGARLIHFALDDVPILSGAGKGVRAIKVEAGDELLGAMPMTRPGDTLKVRLNNDKELTLGQQKYEIVARGGRGWRISQRNEIAEIVRRPIELVDWNTVEPPPAQ